MSRFLSLGIKFIVLDINEKLNSSINLKGIKIKIRDNKIKFVILSNIN